MYNRFMYPWKNALISAGVIVLVAGLFTLLLIAAAALVLNGG